MPETPDPITSADIAGAMQRVADVLEVAQQAPQVEYAGALTRGRNVRWTPSDVLSFVNYPLIPGNPSQLVVPSDELRVRVTLSDSSPTGTGAIFLASRPGVMAGGSDTIEVRKDFPLVLDTRAPIYACVTDVQRSLVVAIEQANY